jgi:hypothetical protein
LGSNGYGEYGEGFAGEATRSAEGGALIKMGREGEAKARVEEEAALDVKLRRDTDNLGEGVGSAMGEEAVNLVCVGEWE